MKHIRGPRLPVELGLSFYHVDPREQILSSDLVSVRASPTEQCHQPKVGSLLRKKFCLLYVFMLEY